MFVVTSLITSDNLMCHIVSVVADLTACDNLYIIVVFIVAKLVQLKYF